MFGVLVVEGPGGRLGWLRAFSGMLDGRWRVEGFAEPLFDARALDGFWPAGEDELRALELKHRALAAGPEPTALRAAIEELVARHREALDALRAVHRERRQLRHSARGEGAAAHPLDQQSRADAAQRRQFDLAHRQQLEALQARLRPLDEHRRRVEAHRARRSGELFAQLHSAYRITNARGEQRELRALFGGKPPPGGAGDCAAPKLLGQAYRERLRPLALAEFWWGAPPLSGDRRAGAYYPSCRGKCGPILPFMLEGLPADDPPLFGAGVAAEPQVILEDEWLVVVDKPAGLLSVPGRDPRLGDCVLARLGRRCPQALAVHRLDLDTSGLLLVAKDPLTHRALQRQFALRQIHKRYVAWLQGPVAGEQGEITLPLRPDPLDRPRQVHDSQKGKPALTQWRVLRRAGGRTLVELFPRTGRTHQLRVHAAHPLGLGASVVGDRLYGQPDARLLLHAAGLSFTHPRTAALLELQSEPPF